ncbi:MAG TPA: hypothetical protein VMY99_05365 [Nevskiaceae bacterium]|nr:hypothetical protein [Nevskiaceae bacterium]
MFTFKKKSDIPVGRNRVAQTQQRGTVFSYHANRSVREGSGVREAELETLQRQKPRWRLRTARHMLIVVLALVLLVFSLRLSPNPSIVLVGDASGRVFLRSTGVYAQAAQQLLTESVLNGNKVTVNAAHIARQLHRQFPELEAVSVSLPFIGHRPTVYIQPAQPQIILSTTSGTSYVLDNGGRALIAAGQIPHADKLQVPVVNDQSGLPVVAGRIALPSSTVAYITEVAGQLKAKNIQATTYTLPARTSELDIRVSGAPYTVKFNIQGSARQQAGAFIATKQLLDSQRKIPGQYVDVRVPDRVYYK